MSFRSPTPCILHPRFVCTSRDDDGYAFGYCNTLAVGGGDRWFGRSHG